MTYIVSRARTCNVGEKILIMLCSELHQFALTSYEFHSYVLDQMEIHVKLLCSPYFLFFQVSITIIFYMPTLPLSQLLAH